VAQVKKDSEMNAVTNIEALALQTNKVDELGSLLAQIAELTARADAIKDGMKDEATLPGGAKVFEGAFFKATHSESNRSVVDWKALVKSCGISADKVAEFTKTTAVFSIKVTSR
jgi:hypothetical protein